jgi:hypothetical protein
MKNGLGAIVMENNIPLSGQSTRAGTADKPITAFSAIKQDYGLQIKVSGCVTLRAAQSRSENVIGIVELDDQIVPILDARECTDEDINDLCCIVLFENMIGQTKIVTGRLYESACQVFDLIVECMDNPDRSERFYAQPIQAIRSKTSKQKQSITQ